MLEEGKERGCEGTIDNLPPPGSLRLSLPTLRNLERSCSTCGARHSLCRPLLLPYGATLVDDAPPSLSPSPPILVPACRPSPPSPTPLPSTQRRLRCFSSTCKGTSCSTEGTLRLISGRRGEPRADLSRSQLWRGARRQSRRAPPHSPRVKARCACLHPLPAPPLLELLMNRRSPRCGTRCWSPDHPHARRSPAFALRLPYAQASSSREGSQRPFSNHRGRWTRWRSHVGAGRGVSPPFFTLELSLTESIQLARHHS